MIKLIEASGFFIYPLAFCSLLAAYVIIERLLALRSSNVVPESLVAMLLEGKMDALSGGDNTAGERIVKFWKDSEEDSDSLKAFAQLEVARLERGFFMLDVVVGAAPLLGLLGTVTGLMQVFSSITPDTGIPETGVFIEGVALALNTTMLGLAVAIPAMVGNAYLGRRVDLYAVKIDVMVHRLLEIKKA